MKVLALYGSPRKDGNSAILARHFLTHAEKRGASVEEINLNCLQLRGCQACNLCKTKFETCVLKDDLTSVLAAIAEADLLLFTSPVYYGDVSAQLKMLIDRTFAFLRPGYIALEQPNRLPAPKPLVFILTQGHRDSKVFADILPRYSDLFGWTGFAKTYPLRAFDVYHQGDAAKRDDLLVQAQTLAEELIPNSSAG